jgi:hypothetical protein
MPRFEVGAQVTIRDTISTQHKGSAGRITRVMPHNRGKHTLDKYEVTLANGEKQVFWDVQLAAVDGKPEQGSS